MAAPKEEDDDDEYEYEEGRWEWDDPDHGGWAKFDQATSAQIETALREKIEEGAGSFAGTIEVALSKGSFFGSSKAKGVYSVTINMGWNGSRPVVNAARQTNIKTGYKRTIRRQPGLDPPLSSEHQEVRFHLHIPMAKCSNVQISASSDCIL